MKDEEKTKEQLIKEMQRMREKVAGLEEIKLKYNQVDKELKQTYKKLQKFIEGTAYIIMKVVETRDPYSIGRQQRVSKLATAIAREMKLPQDKIEGAKIASLVHDIGKVNLPTEIISKPSKLVEVEFNLIKKR
ncbi:unnamed protein product [marine sediment metagenome]|uniref:HD-GYP domain-containing protein n=1 Tax=marine sediment metagenome TaxID=412755 RepID=X1JHH5_9ZZZZ